MAEKEERINILYHDANKLGSGKEIDLSYQEAIERISHAICVKIHGPCDRCEQVRGGNENHCNDYKQYAEAALDALLEP